MKFRRFFFLLFLPFAFLQTISAQNSLNENLFSLNENAAAEKIAAFARPRVYTIARTETTAKPKSVFNKKAVNVFDVERRVFELINEKRTEAGLQALVWNENIARVARLHSESMAANDFFSHEGADGKLVGSRADAAGIKHWRKIGENIAYNRGYADPSVCAAEKWMLSPGHRANILTGDWKESGIGVAVTEQGVFYFTQIFIVKK